MYYSLPSKHKQIRFNWAYLSPSKHLITPPTYLCIDNFCVFHLGFPLKP